MQGLLFPGEYSWLKYILLTHADVLHLSEDLPVLDMPLRIEPGRIQ
jgi:hypothetical protein